MRLTYPMHTFLDFAADRHHSWCAHWIGFTQRSTCYSPWKCTYEFICIHTVCKSWSCMHNDDGVCMWFYDVCGGAPCHPQEGCQLWHSVRRQIPTIHTWQLSLARVWMANSSYILNARVHDDGVDTCLRFCLDQGCIRYLLRALFLGRFLRYTHHNWI